MITERSIFLIITFLFVTGSAQYNESFIRTECYNQYKIERLCRPKYDKCVVSKNKNCTKVFKTCAEQNPSLEGSDFCQQWLVNVTSPSEEHQKILAAELSERDLGNNRERGTMEMCDITIFEDPDLLLSLSAFSVSVVDKIRKLITSYCQCSVKLPGAPSQSTKQIIPNHFYFGGLKPYECWKEVDQYLAISRCGENATIHVNQEWARRSDCLESSLFLNCNRKFLERLEKISEESEKSLFCDAYVEIMERSLMFFNSSFFDHKIVHIREIADSNLNLIPYRDDEIYLMSDPNDNIFFDCFSFKRTITACNYTFTYCNHSGDNQCGNSLTECYKKDSFLSPECLKVLFPPKGFFDGFLGSMSLAMDLFWKALEFILEYVTKGCQNLILIILFLAPLESFFNKIADYFERLLANDLEESEKSMKTVTTEMEETDSGPDPDENDQGVPLLPVIVSTDESQNPNDINTDADIITNNQENATSSNNQNADQTPDAPIDKPKLTTSPGKTGNSVWRLIRAMSLVLYRRCIYPLFVTIRNASVEKYHSSKNRVFGNRENGQSLPI